MKLASGYKAFWEAAHKNYPDQIRPHGLLDQGGIFDAINNVVDADQSDRFAKPSERGWMSSINPWIADKRSTKIGALGKTYRGLMSSQDSFRSGSVSKAHLGTSAEDHSRARFISGR